MMSEYLEQNTALAISLAASTMTKIQDDIGWFQTNLKHEEREQSQLSYGGINIMVSINEKINRCHALLLRMIAICQCKRPTLVVNFISPLFFFFFFF